MGNAVKLTREEFVERAAALKLGEGFDFATNCPYLDRDLGKVAEDDLTDWYGIKKISMFDQVMVLIGNYGGDDSYATTYSKKLVASRDFEFDMLAILGKINVHQRGYTGLYVFEED